LEDSIILALFNERDESAITETAAKYGGYCRKIALNILKNKEDADECVNDTWLRAWNAIPPHKPTVMSSFLGRITRNLSVDAYEKRAAKKRGGDSLTLIFDELEECLHSNSNVEAEFEAHETGNLISAFLKTVSKESRIVFVRRYWYADSISQISELLAMNENKVKTILFRTRKKLKTELEKEGVTL
jgi:RNA polymerase sigma-70 factor (ECF subfamily)